MPLPHLPRPARFVVAAQVACFAAFVALLFVPAASRTQIVAAATIVATSAVLSGYGAYTLSRERRLSESLERSVVAERQISATLEQAVVHRTSELEDAQHVLERMWWLGQQITLELNPKRVLDRFLEAVVGIVRADGGGVGLLTEDGTIRIVAASGPGSEIFVGHQLPVAGSAMGRVIRSGQPWFVADIGVHATDVDQNAARMAAKLSGGVAIVPITRRGERIGAVSVGARRRRLFTELEIERITAMADLLSLALENAELVETLRQAEWRFRTLFRSAPDAVFTVLASGRIREANDAVREVTGYDPLQVVGRPVTDLVYEGDRPALAHALEAAFAGRATRLEVHVEHVDLAAADGGHGTFGRHRVVALAVSRLPEADPPSVLLVGRDMTADREMRGKLMETDRLAAVGELVAGVAHEVNNPLSSISAFAQLLLRDGGLTPTQRDSLEVIKAETLRASAVVKDLLAFARRSEPQREPLDLNAVVARTLRVRAYQLTSSRVQLQQALAPELPAVTGDARQLQQVCLNLVTNAVQAMSAQGGGRLRVTTRAEPGDCVVLEVCDTGPGIPDGVRDHIFEPFFTTKQEGEGTGLGLSVSYGIVTAHGGRIEVVETSAAGTTFRVTLPATSVPASDEPPEAAVALRRRSPLLGTRLLFVDDEPTLRAGLEAFGKLRGFTVIVAADGHEALELARATGVDAIVCDLRMPGMDGAAFHERLRRERPGLASRTVFITGDVVGGVGRLAGAAAGGNGYMRQPVLAKPFTFERLEEALAAVMRA